MTSEGRALLHLALLPVVALLAVFGTGIATFASGDPDGLPSFLLGLAMVLLAGLLLGVILRPLPVSSRRRWQVAGFGCLGVGVLGLVSAAALPAVSAVLRSGPLQIVFSPWGMALCLVAGVALPFAARDGPVSPPAMPATPADWPACAA